MNGMLRALTFLMVVDLAPRSARADDGLGLSQLDWQDSLWFLVPFILSVLVLTSIEHLVRLARGFLRSWDHKRHQEGSSPLHPLAVSSFEEVTRRRLGKCSCGDHFKVVYEGGTTSNKRKLWLTIEICPTCERRNQTYFDVTRAEDHAPLASTPLTPSSQ